MDYLLYNPFSKWTWSAVSTISRQFPSNFPHRFALSISEKWIPVWLRSSIDSSSKMANDRDEKTYSVHEAVNFLDSLRSALVNQNGEQVSCDSKLVLK